MKLSIFIFFFEFLMLYRTRKIRKRATNHPKQKTNFQFSELVILKIVVKTVNYLGNYLLCQIISVNYGFKQRR